MICRVSTRRGLSQSCCRRTHYTPRSSWLPSAKLSWVWQATTWVPSSALFSFTEIAHGIKWMRSTTACMSLSMLRRRAARSAPASAPRMLHDWVPASSSKKELHFCQFQLNQLLPQFSWQFGPIIENCKTTRRVLDWTTWLSQVHSWKGPPSPRAHSLACQEVVTECYLYAWSFFLLAKWSAFFGYFFYINTEQEVLSLLCLQQRPLKWRQAAGS